MSRAQWIEREHIRRLIGDARPSSRFATQSYRSHGSFSQLVSSTRAVYLYSFVKTPLKLKWFTEKFWKPAALSIRR